MKIIVGLGNPGEHYKNNRHNVGQMFIDYLIKEFGEFNELNELTGKTRLTRLIKNKEIIPMKTTGFMNQSGVEVRKFIGNWKLKMEDLIVAHDDLDIPLGKFKIQLAEGPQLHNGIKSIEETLGTKKFWRIRIGIDNRNPENWIAGEAYVLSDFTKEEQTVLAEVFSKISRRLPEIFTNHLA